MAAAEVLLDRQSRLRANISSRVEAVLRQTWTGLGSWRGDDVDRFLEMVVPIIEASQVSMASITEVYLTEVLGDLLDEVPDLPGVSADMTNLRPVPTDEVYKRPFVETWTGLSQGQGLEAAVATGLDRLLRLAEDDLSLAHRRTALMVIDNSDRVTGYRRIIRPELARGGTCGLCASAAQNVYRRRDLLPVHTRCHCEVMPIVRTTSGSIKDPGEGVNDADLTSIYGAAGGTGQKDLKEVRVKVADHGELGPVLRRSGDTFTGPADV